MPNVRRFLLLILLLASPALARTPSVLLVDARKAFEEHSYRPAFEGYDQYLEALPKGPQAQEAHFRMIYCALKLHDVRRSQKLMESWLDKAPDTLWKAQGYALRGEQHHDAHDFERALKLLRGLKQHGELEKQWMLQLADMQPRWGPQAGVAEADYRALIQLDGVGRYGREARLKLGQLYSQQPKDPLDRALREWRELVRLAPTSQEAQQALLYAAQAEEAAQRYNDALRDYQSLLKLSPEKSLAEAAKTQVKNILAPILNLSSAQTLRPGTPVTVNLSTRNLGKVQFTVRSIELVAAVQQAGDLARVADHFQGSSKTEASWTFDAKDDGQHLFRSAEVKVPVQSRGAFLITAESANQKKTVLVIVSRLGLVRVAGFGESALWVVDTVTGTVAGGATGLINGRLLAAGPAGLLEIGSEGASGTVLARQGNDYATMPVYESGQQDSSRPVCYFYTDRPLYRPSQTVHWSAVLRQKQGLAYQNVAGQSFHVRLFNPRYEAIANVTCVASEAGTVAGDFVIPERAALGRWTVQVGEHGSYPLQVEEFRKPEFEVKLQASHPCLLPGEKLEARIQARYYFGEPVAGGEVRWTVRRHEEAKLEAPSPALDYNRYLQPGAPRMYEQPVRDGRYYRPHPPVDLEVATGTGRLDARGALSLSLPAAGTGTYTVSARVTDQAHRLVKGSLAIPRAERGMSLSIDLPRWYWNSNEQVALDVLARDPSGNPQAARAEVQIFKLGGKLPVSVYRESLVIGPEGRRNVRWKSGHNGSYRIEVRGKDRRGQAVGSETTFQVGTQDLIGKPGEFLLKTDRPRYAPGEMARLIIQNPERHSDVLVTVEAEQVLRRMVVHCEGIVTSVPLPLADDLSPNCWVRAAIVRKDKVLESQTTFSVPRTETILKVKATLPKASFQPGEKVKMEIETTDQQGRPAPAEVTLSITDAALAGLMADQSGSIETFFYGVQRVLATRLESSFYQDPSRIHYDEASPKMAAEQSSPRAAAGRPMKAQSTRAGDGPPSVAAAPAAPEPPRVRSYFPDTALWQANVLTDTRGKKTIEFTWPDTLTTWHLAARTVDPNTRVGQSGVEVVIRKELMARLILPRFLTERDRATLSAIVHNTRDKAQQVRLELLSQGLQVEAANATATAPAHGQTNHGFQVKAGGPKAANATVELHAVGDLDGDALKLQIPVLPHGTRSEVGKAGELKEKTQIELLHPKERNRDASLLTLTISPTLMGTLLDSLDYLVDYPYGCVEQTMSRFVPAAVVGKTIQQLNLKRPAIEDKLPKVMQEGIKRLHDFQHADGGWGWWKEDKSSPYMTAYVLYGLSLARQSGRQVDDSLVVRARAYLQANLDTLERNQRAYALCALSWTRSAPKENLQHLYVHRDELSNYARFLLAIALHNQGEKEKSRIVLRNLRDFVQVDKTEGTAHWAQLGNDSFDWYLDPLETTATAIQAYVLIEPNHPLVAQLVRWLAVNRQGNHWKSTRDTSLALLAMSAYLAQQKVTSTEFEYAVKVNGKEVQTGKVGPDNWTQEQHLALRGEEVPDGPLHVEITRKGGAAAYWSAALSYYSFEEDMRATGNGLEVQRSYHRIGHKEPLASGAEIHTGEEIEVQLHIKNSKPCQYLAFEDPKPAGCEALQLLSGHSYADGLCSNVEMRDDRVVFFIGYLAKGERVLRYRLRAEVPGEFHAMPANGWAMYLPDVHAHSDEWRVTIR